MRRTEKGFSLIELSIVLIIIGLLVAGITGGASLVRSSTVRAVMSEANSYNAAVNAYYARFSNLPGDNPSATTLPGNGNGRIEFWDPNLGPTTAAEYSTDVEGLNAWQHLIQADIMEGSYSEPVADSEPGTHYPASKLSGAGWIFDYKGIWNETDGMNSLFLCNQKGIGGQAGGIGVAYKEAVISPNMAITIDSKVDDGIADSGKVKGYDGYGLAAESCVSSAGDYVEDSTPTCAMGFALSL